MSLAATQQEIMDMSVEIVAFGTILVFAAILIGLRCLDRERQKRETLAAADMAGYQQLVDDNADLPHPPKHPSARVWRLYNLAVHGASK